MMGHQGQRRDDCLPKGWHKVKLGDICGFKAGDVFKKEFQGHSSGDIPFIKVSDFEISGNAYKIRNSKNWVSNPLAKSNRYTLHPVDATIFPKIGIALTSNRRRLLSQPTILDNNLMSASPSSESCKPKFLFYLLSTKDFNVISSGSAIPYLTIKDLNSLEVDLPDVKTQERIIHTLSSIDDKIETNQKMSQNLEETAKAIFKSWFVDFDPVRAKAEGRTTGLLSEISDLFPDELVESEIGQIPKGWKVDKVGNQCSRGKVGKLYSNKTVKMRGVIPVLDQTKDSVIGYHSENTFVSASKKNPVITFANHTCNMRLLFTNFSVIQNVIPITPNEFPTVWFYLRTLEVQRFEEYKGHMPEFMNKDLCFPSVLCAEAFERTAFPIFEKIDQMNNENKVLSDLRDTLLPKLISGELQSNSLTETPKEVANGH